MNPDPNQPAPVPAADAPLQFERAELPSAGALSCGFCGNRINESYFEAAGKIACNACQQRLAQFFGARPTGLEYVRSLGAGAGAALLGVLIYWGFTFIARGGQWSLIAIAVGWLVGKAVR